MYDSCAPYDAGAPCQTCAEEYLGAKCTAELVDDMCELPSPALLVALHGSAANEHVVRCARDLVEACAWGTDRAACTSCGTSTVLPQPGSSCTAEHLNAVCKLASDDLADILNIALPPSPPLTPAPPMLPAQPNQPWGNGPSYSNCTEGDGETRYGSEPRYSSLEYGTNHSTIGDAYYHYGSNQRLDVLTSAALAPNASPMPLILFVHGGGWRAGSKCEWSEHLYAISQRGYHFASANYRLSQQAVYPAQLEDIESAVRYLKANAATYNIDRIGLCSSVHLRAVNW